MIVPTMYAEALAARPRARIKKSDNEYVEDESGEILHELKMGLKSVRPAARADAMTDFCDKHNFACLPMPTKTKRAVLLYDLTSYSADKELYDKTIQSNGHMVQKAETGADEVICSDYFARNFIFCLMTSRKYCYIKLIYV